MGAANIPLIIRYKVWVKAFQHATKLDGLVISEIDGKTATRYEHWSGKLSKWVQHPHTWGQSGIVKFKTDTTPKIVDQGFKQVLGIPFDPKPIAAPVVIMITIRIVIMMVMSGWIRHVLDV
jgi:hypothetical protein